MRRPINAAVTTNRLLLLLVALAVLAACSRPAAPDTVAVRFDGGEAPLSESEMLDGLLLAALEGQQLDAAALNAVRLRPDSDPPLLLDRGSHRATRSAALPDGSLLIVHPAGEAWEDSCARELDAWSAAALNPVTRIVARGYSLKAADQSASLAPGRVVAPTGAHGDPLSPLRTSISSLASIEKFLADGYELSGADWSNGRLFLLGRQNLDRGSQVTVEHLTELWNGYRLLHFAKLWNNEVAPTQGRMTAQDYELWKPRIDALNAEFGGGPVPASLGFSLDPAGAGRQQARYDGPLNGTESGMLLFYVDLLAKLWFLDFAGSFPASIDGLPRTLDLAASPLYESTATNSRVARIWFGTANEGFLADETRLRLAPKAVRVFARTQAVREGRLEDIDAAPAYLRAALGWWNLHYREVAAFEPAYERLNQMFKWSLLFAWVCRNDRTEAFSLLDRRSPRRSRWFPDWARDRPDLTFKSWERLDFAARSSGETVESLPWLKSEPVDGAGVRVTLSGGVTLPSEKTFDSNEQQASPDRISHAQQSGAAWSLDPASLASVSARAGWDAPARAQLRWSRAPRGAAGQFLGAEIALNGRTVRRWFIQRARGLMRVLRRGSGRPPQAAVAEQVAAAMQTGTSFDDAVAEIPEVDFVFHNGGRTFVYHRGLAGWLEVRLARSPPSTPQQSGASIEGQPTVVIVEPAFDPAGAPFFDAGHTASVLQLGEEQPELWTGAGRELSKRLEGEAASQRHDEQFRERVRSFASQNGVFVHAGRALANGEIPLQIGGTLVSLSRNDLEALEAAGQSPIPELDTAVSGSGGPFVLVSDLYFQRPGIDRRLDLDDFGGTRISPFRLASLLNRRYGPDARFFVDDRMERAAENLAQRQPLSSAADIAVLIPNASFEVSGVEPLWQSIEELLELGVNVRTEYLPSAQDIPQSNILVIEGHRDEELEEYLAALGAAGVLLGKQVVLFSCGSAPAAESASDWISRHGALSVHWFPEAIGSLEAGVVARELAARAAALKGRKADLDVLLRESIDHQINENPGAEGRRPYETLRNGITQISHAMPRRGAPHA